MYKEYKANEERYKDLARVAERELLIQAALKEKNTPQRIARTKFVRNVVILTILIILMIISPAMGWFTNYEMLRYILGVSSAIVLAYVVVRNHLWIRRAATEDSPILSLNGQ